MVFGGVEVLNSSTSLMPTHAMMMKAGVDSAPGSDPPADSSCPEHQPHRDHPRIAAGGWITQVLPYSATATRIESIAKDIGQLHLGDGRPERASPMHPERPAARGGRGVAVAGEVVVRQPQR
jgi:hypothetical protein